MQNNIAVIQSVYRAMTAKDGEAIHKLSHPEIEVRQSEELPWGGTYKGLQESIGFFHRVGTFLESHVRIDGMLDAGDTVAAIGRTEGTVRSNGQSFTVPFVHLWTLKDERVARLEVFLDNPAMLTALAQTAPNNQERA